MQPTSGTHASLSFDSVRTILLIRRSRLSGSALARQPDWA
jgi:hypothetical protein